MLSSSAARRVAIVTGGTRGIGRGISEALADAGFDLLLAYNTDAPAAETTAAVLRERGRVVELIGGDVAQETTRDALFARFDAVFAPTHALGAVVHNAGQYVGVTSTNAEGLEAPSTPQGFGDGSLLLDKERGGGVDVTRLHYYQRLYGDAYVDLCERGLARMGEDGGTLVGVSSPGCTLQYKANLGYDLPGAGKCVMEYAMRLIALRCAARGVNCNVVVPGVTRTEAWDKLAAARGTSADDLVGTLAARLAPAMHPRQLGDVVAFLCTPQGRVLTGLSLPVDNGVHLRA